MNPKSACLAIILGAITFTNNLWAGEEPPLAISSDAETLSWGPCPAFMPAGCQIAVLHGDPAAPNADIYFKVPGGSRIPNHTHTSAERIVMVAGTMTVNYQGHPPATLKVGDYAYGPPGMAHTADCHQGAECILFIAFEQPVDAFAQPDDQ